MRIFSAAGGAIALAGTDKLIGDRSYEAVFRRLGWSRDDMRRLGGLEVLGGVLMTWKPTRRLGAAVVLAASASVLASELKLGDQTLAASRAGVLLTALAAVLVPG